MHMLLMEGCALSRRSIKGVEQVGAPGQRDVEQGGVDILDDVVIEGVLEAAQLGARPVGQAVAVAGVARKIINPVKVAVLRQAETGRAPGGQNHAFGPDDHRSRRCAR